MIEVRMRLKMEPMGFADGSDMESERKKGVRDDFKFLSNF